MLLINWLSMYCLGLFIPSCLAGVMCVHMDDLVKQIGSYLCPSQSEKEHKQPILALLPSHISTATVNQIA